MHDLRALTWSQFTGALMLLVVTTSATKASAFGHCVHEFDLHVDSLSSILVLGPSTFLSAMLLNNTLELVS